MEWEDKTGSPNINPDEKISAFTRMCNETEKEKNNGLDLMSETGRSFQ